MKPYSSYKEYTAKQEGRQKSLDAFNDKPKCQTCGNGVAIKAGVPWGKDECEECRTKTGYCRICGANRNDCCC